MALMLYSEGLAQGGDKNNALIALIKERVVLVVTKERDLANILSSMNLLRVLALLQSPENKMISLPVLQNLNELLVFSQSVIAEDYHDSDAD